MLTLKFAYQFLGEKLAGILIRITLWITEDNGHFNSIEYVFCKYSVQSLSHVPLCDPMGQSTPGLPVHHQLPEFTQTHVHRVGDAFQPSHPLSSPSPPAPNPSQHQGLFKWVSSSHFLKLHFSVLWLASHSLIEVLLILYVGLVSCNHDNSHF